MTTLISWPEGRKEGFLYHSHKKAKSGSVKIGSETPFMSAGGRGTHTLPFTHTMVTVQDGISFRVAHV